MATPELKIYNADGEYTAACRHAEDAAAIVSLFGRNAKVKWHHVRTIWTEGVDGVAADSYDLAAARMHERIDAIHKKPYAKAMST